MQKARQPGSLRSEGMTVIAIDKPTRAMLKEVANKAGLPLSQYLKQHALKESGKPPGMNLPATKADLNATFDSVVRESVLMWTKAMCAALGIPFDMDYIRNQVVAKGRPSIEDGANEAVEIVVGYAKKLQEDILTGLAKKQKRKGLA